MTKSPSRLTHDKSLPFIAAYFFPPELPVEQISLGHRERKGCWCCTCSSAWGPCCTYYYLITCSGNYHLSCCKWVACHAENQTAERVPAAGGTASLPCLGIPTQGGKKLEGNMPSFAAMVWAEASHFVLVFVSQSTLSLRFCLQSE